LRQIDLFCDTSQKRLILGIPRIAVMEVTMEKAQVEAAVLSLLQAGVTWPEISAPKVRQALGAGSYRDILKHLRTLKASAGIVVEDEPSEGEEPDEAEPPPAGDMPGQPLLADPIAEAEQALSDAQAALQRKLNELPAAEADLAEARARVVGAVSNQLAMVEAAKRGLLPSDDPGRAEAAAEVDDAASAYRHARQAWRWAVDGVEGFGQRVREAQASLKATRRQHFLQTHHPELVQALADALEAQANDPWLSPQADPRALPAVQHRYQHQYALDDIRQRLEAACRAAGL
jgi:hypothetical protein